MHVQGGAGIKVIHPEAAVVEVPAGKSNLQLKRTLSCEGSPLVKTVSIGLTHFFLPALGMFTFRISASIFYSTLNASP